MDDRENALSSLAVGDIFHGRSPNGASLICLVTSIDEGTIHARRIHTQDDLQFDRRTGIELGSVKSKIDCVEPLPPEVHNIFLAMDRRYQDAHALIHQGIDMDPRFARWTAEERRAHGVLDEHIAANPI
jgi:hypothetical protein